MGQAIGDLLPAAVGVALSPVPIIAVILMLGTPQARTNGPAFGLGWVVGLSVVSVIVVLRGERRRRSRLRELHRCSTGSGCCSGCSSWSWPFGQWRKRPQPGQEPEMPKWMAAIDTFNPRRLVRTRRRAVGRQPEEPRPHRRRRRVDRPGGPQRRWHRRGDRESS